MLDTERFSPNRAAGDVRETETSWRSREGEDTAGQEGQVLKEGFTYSQALGLGLPPDWRLARIPRIGKVDARHTEVSPSRRANSVSLPQQASAFGRALTWGGKERWEEERCESDGCSMGSSGS